MKKPKTEKPVSEDELDEFFLKRIPLMRKLADFEDLYLYALNEPLEKELAFWENPSEAAKQLPHEVRSSRFRAIGRLLEVQRHGNLLALIEEKRVLRCSLCSKYFIAKRKTQTQCSACSKKTRNRDWRLNYEKEHGHPYQQKREPAFVKKVRSLLVDWPGFKPTLENKKNLAADADVTLKQCEAALEIISEEHKQKRTGPARKRR